MSPRDMDPGRAPPAPAGFSIVMPVWNKAPFLAATLAAALAQEWRAFELIAVDDGSTDGSLDILRRERDPRLRIIAQANAGPGAARNAGIEAARHAWIALLDADDLWLPGHLSELDRIRALHPDAGLIGTSYTMARQGRLPRPDPGRPGRIGRIDFLAAAAGGDPGFITSSCAIHRRVYEDLGGFGPSLIAEDTEYWVRIALRWPMAASTRRTVVYLIETGGITDRIAHRPRAEPPAEASDLSPAAALLVARRSALPGTERVIDAFIGAQIQGSARVAARIADVETLRGLRAFAPRPRSAVDRLIFAIAGLPRPIARAACRIGFPLWQATAPLRRWRWRRIPRLLPQPGMDPPGRFADQS